MVDKEKTVVKICANQYLSIQYDCVKFYLDYKLRMEVCARCYLLDSSERILLVKHSDEQPWVLPGGHLEAEETIYECLEREVQEEVGLGITVVWVENTLSAKNIATLPLPISIHRVKYEHRTRGDVDKIEYFFFARVNGEVTNHNNEEIVDYKWMEYDDIMDLKSDEEIHQYTQDILEQNFDLLELIG